MALLECDVHLRQQFGNQAPSVALLGCWLSCATIFALSGKIMCSKKGNDGKSDESIVEEDYCPVCILCVAADGWVT